MKRSPNSIVESLRKTKKILHEKRHISKPS